MTEEQIKSAVKDALGEYLKNTTHYGGQASIRQQALAMAWQFQPGRSFTSIIDDAIAIENYLDRGERPAKLKSI